MMKPLSAAPNLAEQVCDAVLGEIAAGRLVAGARVVQEPLAQALGVSRQPVQQALLLLRNQGTLVDAPGRGLVVAPLAADAVRDRYELRTAVERLAARLAAERGAERAARLGPALIDAGRKAVAAGSVARLVAADLKFHRFIYELSGNPLIAPALEPHWTHTQRAMAEVLARDERPRDIWDQHAAILQAIADAAPARAETLMREHLTQAAGYLVERLQRRDGVAAAAPDRPAAAPTAPSPPRRARAPARGDAR